MRTHLIIFLAIIATVLAVSPSTGAIPYASAAAGSYVDSVTFIKEPNPADAVDHLIAGGIDMYYLSISEDDAQKVRDAGHDTYGAVGGTAYKIYVNPTDDYTQQFNPFSLREARFALNYAIDRDQIVNDLLGSGTPMYSALPPHHPDYIHVYKYIESLEISYDISRADAMITGALESAGATKSGGAWHYDGTPITIKIFIRDDDNVRLQIGENLASTIEGLGFAVEKRYGDLLDALEIVYDPDPADQKWHLYTGAWGDSSGAKYDSETLKTHYAPHGGFLPGAGEDHVWNYEHAELDRVTRALSDGMFDSAESRAELVATANRLGIQEAVRISLAGGNSLHPVRDGVTGVVNVQGDGIASRYTAINAQLPKGDDDLVIGALHVVQDAWNPVGGLRDAYSIAVWELLRDVSFVYHPHTLELLNGRNVLVSVYTDGPDKRIEIPSSAIIWNPDTGAWDAPDTLQATSRVTIDLELGGWHHGIPVDLNDILYAITLGQEYEDTSTSNPYDGISPSSVVAVNILDSDRIEVYVDYWHFDKAEIVASAGLWPSIPWEIHHAMEAMVNDGNVGWTAPTSIDHGIVHLDMINHTHAALARSHLVAYMDDTHDRHMPEFLYQDASSEYVNARYDAAISWIDENGHMVISNGPFYLSDVIERNQDGSVARMVLQQFDDPLYPFGPGKWSEFADYGISAGAARICR